MKKWLQNCIVKNPAEYSRNIENRKANNYSAFNIEVCRAFYTIDQMFIYLQWPLGLIWRK
jgi:hypothetical protein